MKGFVLLLCVIAAVQGRSGVQVDSRSGRAELGQNPWLVHLRFATNNGNGLLSTCVGTLISSSHVLTTASCVSDARFIWHRLGVIEVIRPSLVIEASTVTLHPGYNAATGVNNLAIISLNRVVETSSNIVPAPVESSDDVPSTASFCTFGVEADDSPGEHLSCGDVTLAAVDASTLVAVSNGVETIKYDSGAPIVSDGRLVGFLTNWPENFIVGSFIRPVAYLDWIRSVTG